MMGNKIEMMLYTVMILQVIDMFDGDPMWVAGGVVGIAMFFEVFYPWLYGKQKKLRKPNYQLQKAASDGTDG